jgi:CTP synthase (UTP-ammonia lyase)
MAESYDNLSNSVRIVIQLLTLYQFPSADVFLTNIDVMQVKIALVGKYNNLTDSYLSVVKVGQESFFNI